MRVLFGHLGRLNVCTVFKSKARFILRLVEIAMYCALWCYNIVVVNGAASRRIPRAKASVSTRVGVNGASELSLAEFGPRHRGKVELCVREVPEEKIAQALLSAGANEEVRSLGEGTLR